MKYKCGNRWSDLDFGIIPCVQLAFVLLIFVCAGYGVVLERHPTTDPYRLFLGLHLAGLGAMALIFLVAIRAIASFHRRCLLVFLELLAFRVAYFPVLVLSATIACYSEWLMKTLDPVWPVRIFPALFICVAAMFAAIAALTGYAVRGERTAMVMMVLISVPALMISFSSRDDLILLPDTNWTARRSVPDIVCPKDNAYRSSDLLKGLNPAQSTIALAGSILYEVIPNAAWAQAVRGTLEHAFRKNPAGSSRDRLDDHYAAFLAAHNKKSELHCTKNNAPYQRNWKPVLQAW